MSTPLSPVRFLENLEEHMTTFLESRRVRIGAISPEADSLIEVIEQLSLGGKRLRALLCYWGWRVGGGPPESYPCLSRASLSIELFHTAALIHDDIIDRSDTRRKGPSAHRRFEGLTQSFLAHRLTRERFGVGAAILAGDLCLSLSEEIFASIDLPPEHPARTIFDRMRWEVMTGQYLDIWEQAWGSRSIDQTQGAAERARTILRYKSAKYSTERPFELGGAIAGASEALLETYAEFALPLGEAFQLNDDVLGVFGDPATTGKPAGDDLCQGKRTVLVAYAREMATPAERAFIDTQLGSPQMNDTQLAQLRQILVTCGAKQRVERDIRELTEQAQNALGQLTLDDEAATALHELSQQLAGRHA